MAIVSGNEITPRESIQHEWDVDLFRMQADHALKMKQLEIAQLKVEAKWNSWLRLPAMLIKLPVWCILSVAYIINSIRNKNPNINFWRLLNGQPIDETKNEPSKDKSADSSHR